MFLKINGDLNRYYLQTVCMLFFPGATFSESEDDSAEDMAEFTRRNLDGEVEVTCTFTSDGKSESATRTMKIGTLHGFDENGSSPEVKAAKVAAGLAALDAGVKLFGCYPAWGILTGIRPAKLASELISKRDENGARVYTSEQARRLLTREYHVSPKKAALAVEIARSEQKIARLAGDGKAPYTCSVYVSIPFCPTRCAYCSFVSYSTKRLLAQIPDYLKRICDDTRNLLAYLKLRGFKVLTVYVGGGTPTTLSDAQLAELLGAIDDNIPIKRLNEFTLEAGRPDTITKEKLLVAKEFGVSRISINPQTMNDAILKNIGRRHTVSDFRKAFKIAREVGIPQINTDLIAGLPGDSFATFSKSLNSVLKLAPENITVHTFCVKKSAEILRLDTEIYNRSADETVKSVDYSQVTLKNAGYNPYYIYRQKNTVGNLENVGYSQKGCEGLYNVLMMEELHSVFAVGAGAATKLVRVGEDGKKYIERIFDPKYPYEYLATDPGAAMEEKIRKIEEFFEF